MRNKLAISLALAGLIAAGPAFALDEDARGYKHTPSPEVADQTLGMAVMSISVLSGCATFRGAGATGVSKQNTGICHVSFHRNIRDCFLVSSIGAFSTTVATLGSTQMDYIAGATNDNTVRIETFNTSGTLVDTSFHVIAFCAT